MTISTLTVAPSADLSGTITLPGDKSISHRAALFAALAEGTSHIENFLVAGVTHAMLNALTSLEVEWELDDTSLTVQGPIPVRRTNIPTLFCGNSGTTMRLLAGAVAGVGLSSVLDGSPGLRRRPMERITVPLGQMGADITALDGRAPLTIRPAALSGAHYTLPIASAQVKSCVLLAALGAEGTTVLLEPGPSRDHTERMLRGMGVTVSSDREDVDGVLMYRTTLVPPTQPLAPLALALPGDISSAAFLMVAALITPGAAIKLSGVGLNPTRTGIVDALQAMGGDITISNMENRYDEPVGDITVRHSTLHGIEVGGDLVVRMIDEFPVFSIAAAHAHGQTVVRDAVELRHKESDRITRLCEQLTNVGIAVREKPDGFVLPGRTPAQGGTVTPHGDHRLAMSLAVAGLAARAPITVQDAAIIHESFPGFKPSLAYLGAQID